MKTFADNPTVLASITPNHLKTYLLKQNWTFAQPFLEHGEIWAYQNDLTTQILIPNSPTLGDYLPRIREALTVLETIEQRPQPEILLDLLPSIPHFQTQGIITNLYEGAREGRITLTGIVLNKLRRIHIDLPEPLYETALQAYRGRIPIHCQGTLIPQGHTLQLHDLQAFTLDPEPQPLPALVPR